MLGSNHRFGYLMYVALVALLLSSTSTMSAFGQIATPAVEESNPGISDAVSDPSSEHSEPAPDAASRERITETTTPGTPQEPTMSALSAETTSTTVPWWLVVHAVGGTITPGSTHTYYMDITSPQSYSTYYYVLMTSSTGASISIPQTFNGTYE